MSEHTEKYAVIVTYGSMTKKMVYARSNKWEDIQKLHKGAIGKGYSDAEIVERQQEGSRE